MWCTAYGERTLKGAEAMLFAETLLNIVDIIGLSRFYSYDTGVEVFDRLAFGQKISVLAVVGNGLLRKDVPCVELTDVMEGAIGAVFEHLINLIDIEIDDPERGYDWREKVFAARKETVCQEHPDQANGSDMLTSNCGDLEKWIVEVDYLVEGILCDAGYDDDFLYLGYLPADSNSSAAIGTGLLRQMVGISDNYYCEIVENLKDEDIGKKIRELKELCLLVVESF